MIHINTSIIDSLMNAANYEGEIWLDVNGSSKRFEVYCEDDNVVMAVFKDVEIAISTEDATVLQISFKNPKSLDFDIADTMKNLCHADVKVAG